MQIRNLYEEYFDADECRMPYGSEEDYREDLFRYLDMLLAIVAQKRAGAQTEAGARSGKTGQDMDGGEAFSGERIAGMVKCADYHIAGRLRRTENAQQFRYRYLISRMGFSEWESFLLLLAFAVSHDAKYETVFSRLQGDSRDGLPSFQLAISLYELGRALPGEEMANTAQLRGALYDCFLDIAQADSRQPLAGRFCLKKRVCAFLYGRNDVAPGLVPLTELYCYTDGVEPIRIREEKAKELLSYLRQTLGKNTSGNLLQIYGPEGIGRKYLLKYAMQECRGNLLFVHTDKLLMGTIAEIRQILHALKLESILLGALLVFCDFEMPPVESEMEAGRQMPHGISFLAKYLQTECRLAIWLSKEKADFWMQYPLSLYFMELDMLSAREREIFFLAYGQGKRFDEDVNLQLSASQYILTPRGIRQVLDTAGIFAGGNPITRKHIRDAVGQQSLNQLGHSAVLLRSVYTWDDLVIGKEQRSQMEMICNQVRFRRVVGEQWGFHQKTAYGRGVCALFYGSPGTGKTMAVQVIANELGLDLYRVDLSQIVSKYIGETQKNISDLFKRAKNANVLLFFDEADALFAKRLTVKDHHDRNANSETAHLLQKLEDYEGVVILATNYADNIDDAFKRRIKFMVNFAFPTPEVRLTLWNTILPKAAPLEEELDFEFFARQFEMSGSNIKEVLTNAAYIAAAENRGIRNQDVAESIRLNFAKYGKVLTADDFGYLGVTMKKQFLWNAANQS